MDELPGGVPLGVAVVGVTALILGAVGAWILVRWRYRTHIELDPRALPTAVVRLRSDVRTRVTEHLADAATARRQRQAATSLPSRIRFGRVLWLDHEPDGFVHETLALEALGLPVTKTTRSAIALEYVDRQQYAVFIGGIEEQDDGHAIGAFLDQVRTRCPGIVTIGYAAPAVQARVQVPGMVVVEEPVDLVDEIVRALALTK